MKSSVLVLAVLLLIGVASAVPVNSMLGSNGVEKSPFGNVVPFIRISPTTTDIHYSPFPTGVYFLPDDTLRLELCVRIAPGSIIGTWGTIFGNTGRNRSDGFQLRQLQGSYGVGGYYPLVSRQGQEAGNTSYGDVSDWAILEFDSTLPAEEMLLCNGNSLFPWLGFVFDYSRLKSTDQLYVGEGPRGGGATCSTDWRYVRIWINGELVREYVPDTDGSFYDAVSGTNLHKDSRSNTAVHYFEEEVECE